MKASRAILFGLLGAASISALSAILRAIGVPISIEMYLGTLFHAGFVVGLLVHLVLGAAFGLLYSWLFEKVWNHGGVGTGIILSALHASLIGMALGLTPQFHPAVPSVLPNPGAFFSNFGAVGVIAFYALHAVYGAIVGGGYGHVASEHQWAPTGRL